MKKLLALSLAALVTTSMPAIAKTKKHAADSVPHTEQQNLGIAAQVGEDVISSYDVENRIKFIIATANLSNTPDVIEKIRPQVIRSLIDEKLQLQEAKKNNITIADNEIGEAITAIENQRGMPPGTIFKLLDADHVPKETFTDQIRAQLAWNKLATKTLHSRVKISDEEVALATSKFTAQVAAETAAKAHPAKLQELQIAVLAMPVDKRAHEAEVGRLAEKLVKEMRAGASFEEVSRQFAGSSPRENGKVAKFWVRPEQLDPAVARALAHATNGSISDPVRTNAGFTIVKVYDTHAVAGEPEKKDEEVLLKEFLFKLKPSADRKEADILLQIGEEVSRHPGTCEEKGLASIENLQDFDIDVNFRRALTSELPSALRMITDGLKVGQISTPFASNEGIRMFMLCARGAPTPKPLDPERVYSLLFQQKMEMEAQKYMRDLRREAFIDVR